MIDKIKANAEFVIKQLGPLSGFKFGLNAESVAWVDSFIEQQRIRLELDADAINGIINVLGSFLGECIIQCFGGAWDNLIGEWFIKFDKDKAAFPFSKVRKQFANGKEDSISSFFDSIPVLFAIAPIKPIENVNQEELNQLESLIQKAEKANTEMLEGFAHANRKEAFEDSRRYLNEAIQIAKQLNLKEKAEELEKNWNISKCHYKSQMDF